MTNFILLHNQTFINLYGKVYHFIINAVIDGLEQDRKITRIIYGDLLW